MDSFHTNMSQYVILCHGSWGWVTPHFRAIILSALHAARRSFQRLHIALRTMSTTGKRSRAAVKSMDPISSIDTADIEVKPKKAARKKASTDVSTSSASPLIQPSSDEPTLPAVASEPIMNADAAEIESKPKKAARKKPATDVTSPSKPIKPTSDESTESVVASSVDPSASIPQSPLVHAVPLSPHQSFKAMSWNVAGLRALLRTEENKINSREVLRKLIDEEKPDAFCLLEHKLQTSHVAECEQELRSFLPSEYGTFYWAVSTAKNGYSGVVVIAKGPLHSEIDGVPASAASAAPAAKEKKESKTKPITAFFKKSSDAEVLPASTSTPVAASAVSSSSPAGSWGASGSPLKVRYGLTGKQSHSDEGRAITLSFASFHITFTYVPNAGEGLKRLDHRLQTWERDMLSHLEWLKSDGSARVVIGGDLNCAHLDSDIWNNGAKHLFKQPGCTPQERQAFTDLLTQASLVDSFRQLHQNPTGWFTYWSQRAGNRAVNRGLRLDYFLISSDLIGNLHASYMSNSTVGVSDHAPVVLQLKL